MALETSNATQIESQAAQPQNSDSTVVDHFEASGFRVTAARRFAIRYKQHFVNSQIDMCRPRLDALKDGNLAGALMKRGEDLRARELTLIETEGALTHGLITCSSPNRCDRYRGLLLTPTNRSSTRIDRA